jgi:hypothetical protein
MGSKEGTQCSPPKPSPNVQQTIYKPKGNKKVDEIKLSSFNSNSNSDSNSSNGPSEQNDKVEVSPKKICFGKK